MALHKKLAPSLAGPSACLEVTDCSARKPHCLNRTEVIVEGTAWWCFSGVHMICMSIKWRSTEVELGCKVLELDGGVTRTGCGRTAGSGGDCCAALWVVQHSVLSCGAAAAEQEVLPLVPVPQSVNMASPECPSCGILWLQSQAGATQCAFSWNSSCRARGAAPGSCPTICEHGANPECHSCDIQWLQSQAGATQCAFSWNSSRRARGAPAPYLTMSS